MAGTDLTPHQAFAIDVKKYINAPSIQTRLNDMLQQNKESFVTTLLNVVGNNKDLAKYKAEDVIKCAMISASLQLSIDPNLGFSALVPYGDNLTFQIMYKGFVQLALRSGQYRTINASIVYKDELDYYNPHIGEIIFTPYEKWEMRELGRDEDIAGYCSYLELLTGFHHFFYMSKAQMEKHAKKYSQTYKKGYGKWKDDFNAMGIKTVLKLNLSKYGILSPEMQKAIAFDQAKVSGTIENPTPEYLDNPDNAKQIENKPASPFANNVIEGEVVENKCANCGCDVTTTRAKSSVEVFGKIYCADCEGKL